LSTRRLVNHSGAVFASALFVATGLAACRSRPEPPTPSDTARGQSVGSATRAPAVNERQKELDELISDVTRDAEIRDERVALALRRVPRHRFVPDDVSDAAYENRPLPIGHNQTISQPTVVAVMTATVAPERTDRCLEIGTGSGYQAAILAELCGKVYSIEYVEALARFAEKNLRGAGYGPERVELRTGDGYELLERVRAMERRRGQAAIPAALITAYTEERDRQKAFEVGFAAHLAKPVEPSRVVAAVLQLAHSRS
jgi:protein-L-isoaspartate(D-aspartate) O-methyltransferase